MKDGSGPRGDKSVSGVSIQSLANCMWTCAFCTKLIDQNEHVEFFTVAKLSAIRAKAIEVHRQAAQLDSDHARADLYANAWKQQEQLPVEDEAHPWRHVSWQRRDIDDSMAAPFTADHISQCSSSYHATLAANVVSEIRSVRVNWNIFSASGQSGMQSLVSATPQPQPGALAVQLLQAYQSVRMHVRTTIGHSDFLSDEQVRVVVEMIELLQLISGKSLPEADSDSELLDQLECHRIALHIVGNLLCWAMQESTLLRLTVRSDILRQLSLVLNGWHSSTLAMGARTNRAFARHLLQILPLHVYLLQFALSRMEPQEGLAMTAQDSVKSICAEIVRFKLGPKWCEYARMMEEVTQMCKSGWPSEEVLQAQSSTERQIAALELPIVQGGPMAKPLVPTFLPVITFGNDGVPVCDLLPRVEM